MSQVVIGVDLGGTRLRAARLDQQLHMLQRTEKLTLADEGLDAVLGRIKTIIRTVLPEDLSTVAGIGISAPGPLNPKAGVVVAPPNLKGWKDVPLADIITEAFGVPVYIGNDANVAALAEASVGDAKGKRHAIYLTISTGIGSGIINDGRLVLGRTGLAAEAGHVIIMVDGRISTLEKEAAGPALARQARERIQQGDISSISDLCNHALDDIDAKIIGTAANDGDTVATQIVERAGRIVGLGLVSLMHLFNPEIIIIGGGVSYIGDLLFDQIRTTVQTHTIDDDYWKDTPIIPSAISEDVSILGSAMLVLTEGGHINVNDVLRDVGLD